MNSRETFADREAVRELVLYAENDFITYSYSILPACENLKKKVTKGVYDREKAKKLFNHVATFAAKRYAKEFANEADWFRIFTAETRRQAAVELLDSFTDHFMGGVKRD